MFKTKIECLKEFGLEKPYWSKEHNLLNSAPNTFEENEKFPLLRYQRPLELNFLPFILLKKSLSRGTSSVAQWLGLRAPSAGGPGSIPGWGSRSHMHATTKEPTCHK